MTDAQSLLAQLESQGFRLRADGGTVRVSPASRLTAAQKDAIVEHKPLLLALLRQRGFEPCADDLVPWGELHDAASWQEGWRKLAGWFAGHNRAADAAWRKTCRRKGYELPERLREE